MKAGQDGRRVVGLEATGKDVVIVVTEDTVTPVGVRVVVVVGVKTACVGANTVKRKTVDELDIFMVIASRLY